jgi:hypothetical protein
MMNSVGSEDCREWGGGKGRTHNAPGAHHTEVQKSISLFAEPIYFTRRLDSTLSCEGMEDVENDCLAYERKEDDVVCDEQYILRM